MAVDTLTPISLTLNDGADVTGRTAITAANTFRINVSNVKDHKLVVHVLNTGAEKDITFNAGDVGALSSLGNLVVTLAATTGEQIVCLESSRFFDSDGYVTGSYEASMTGYIAAYLLP